MTTKAESAGTGLRNILVATAIAGLLGYAIQLLAPALLADDASYVTFSVFWSTLYLCVATLSGVQQEVTRATHPADGHVPTTVLRRFTFLAAGSSLAVVVVLSLLLGSSILPGPTLVLAAALSLGVVGYLLIAVLSGVLYGLRMWNAIAWITVVDAVVRAVLVVAGLAAGWDPGGIAFAVSLPFGLAFLAVWLRVRPSVIGGFRLDVTLKVLLAHVAGTVVAAAAMGVMMNGLPLLLGLTTSRAETVALAALMLAITVTRAPIVVPLLALQSYLISAMRGGGEVVRRRVMRALVIAAAAVAALSALAALIGPPIIAWISGDRFHIGAAMMGVITASAGLVAMMCLTGPALLAARRHVPYVAGWVVAALATVAFLLVRTEIHARVGLALLLPPAIGLVVHAIAVWRYRAVEDVPPGVSPAA